MGKLLPGGEVGLGHEVQPVATAGRRGYPSTGSTGLPQASSGRVGPYKHETAKRSQFSGVLDVVDWLNVQGVSSRSAPIYRLASFVENWLRFGGLASFGRQIMSNLLEICAFVGWMVGSERFNPNNRR